MGYKNSDSCIKKAFDDERLFVLMARDPSAPMVIIEWIKHNITMQPREKLIEALDAAIEMSKRNGEFTDRKIAECRDCGGECKRKDLTFDEDSENDNKSVIVESVPEKCWSCGVVFNDKDDPSTPQARNKTNKELCNFCDSLPF